MSISEPSTRPPATPALRVMGAPPRSLFDTVRPALVQRAGARLRGPGGMALAALQQDGVTRTGTGPPDVVVLGGRTFGRPRDGWTAIQDEGRALGVAYGLAMTRRRHTTPGRTWCLLRATAVAEGRTLEVVTLLEDLPLVSLVPVVVGSATATARATALLRACGVRTWQADNADAWSVLSAMDHATRVAGAAATAVVATREVEA